MVGGTANHGGQLQAELASAWPPGLLCHSFGRACYKVSLDAVLEAVVVLTLRILKSQALFGPGVPFTRLSRKLALGSMELNRLLMDSGCYIVCELGSKLHVVVRGLLSCI